MDRVLDCQILRRFGVEVELNTLNGIIKKLDEDEGEIPYGAERVACLINRTLRVPVEIQGWHHTFNNDEWIVKPDSSCGIEVCSPILKGWRGLKSVVEVIRAFRDADLVADKRCSLHVHVNIGDLTQTQLASVIAWYVKCEHVILDSVPSHRKINRYCQMLGMSDLFDDETRLEPDELIDKVGRYKYYSMNANRIMRGGGFGASGQRKPTMEFRIAENDACLDPFFVKNWVRLLLHFVEVTKNQPLPNEYRKGDQWSGLLWLSPREVFQVMRLDEPISPGLRQVKDWFCARILDNGYDSYLPGIFSNAGRKVARSEFLSMAPSTSLGAEIRESEEELLFAKKYTV